jgi:hypothetical protein
METEKRQRGDNQGKGPLWGNRVCLFKTSAASRLYDPWVRNLLATVSRQLQAFGNKHKKSFRHDKHFTTRSRHIRDSYDHMELNQDL